MLADSKDSKGSGKDTNSSAIDRSQLSRLLCTLLTVNQRISRMPRCSVVTDCTKWPATSGSLGERIAVREQILPFTREGSPIFRITSYRIAVLETRAAGMESDLGTTGSVPDATLERSLTDCNRSFNIR
jgi:hypothetical protein